MRRGSILPTDVWSNKYPTSARSERWRRLIKHGVWEIKLKINNKRRVGGAREREGDMHPAARLGGRVGPVPPPRLPAVPRARLPPAVPAHVPRCRAKEERPRQVPPAGAKEREKGGGGTHMP